MRPDAKAVIFDLDDTLYTLREFVRSGFAAVARHLEQGRGVNGDEAFALLTQAEAGSAHVRELQACAMHFDLPPAIVPELVEVIRWHTPSLTLPARSRAVLEALRRDWSIGVLTNGR